MTKLPIDLSTYCLLYKTRVIVLPAHIFSDSFFARIRLPSSPSPYVFKKVKGCNIVFAPCYNLNDQYIGFVVKTWDEII